MSQSSPLPHQQIGPDTGYHAPLGMGGSFYGLSDYNQQADDLLAAMAVALDAGITHFDTAEGYGGGESEKLIGRFIAEDSTRRDKIFLASKANINKMSQQAVLEAIENSLRRLQTDMIDLYYIHWPRTGKDLRPLMEGLEMARSQGKIRAVGVSNFSVAQMQQVAEVGTIDAHQLGYNLLWRFAERDILPYCAENRIAVVVYSALAHGILSGKYARQLAFIEGDLRWRITLFREDVWPQVYEAVVQFKQVAQRADRSLVHLALRWLLNQAAVNTVLVSAKNPQQAQANADALSGEIPQWVFDELDQLSADATQSIPDEGNPFGYHP